MAEPVREAGRADAGVVAGDEDALIRDFQAVVGRVDIGHDVPRIVGRAQEAPDELVQPEPFGAGQLDGAVDRRALGDIGQGGGNVIGRFGLEEDGRQRNRPVVGAGIGDATDELEELRRAQDRAGDAASGSWPSARSLVTSFDPIRPVPPITTIFICFPSGFVSDGLLRSVPPVARRSHPSKSPAPIPWLRWCPQGTR